MRTRAYRIGGAALALLLAGSGCSVKRFAINQVGNALSGSGTTFASDEDPELIKAAVPFSLKLMESLLAESPHHQGLLLATASGFTQYAYAFVQPEGEELEGKDLDAAWAVQSRARKLYLRARNYGLRGLEARHPGITSALHANAEEAVKRATSSDVPLLYWTGAAWGAAISLSKNDANLIGELPIVTAIMTRALQLNEAYDYGALHSFFITYAMSRPGDHAEAEKQARAHFERAVALSQGQQAGPFVALAEAVCIQKQDLKEFKSLLDRALAVNSDQRPEWRLANLVMQRRAKWLLSRTEDLFLNAPAKEDSQ